MPRKPTDPFGHIAFSKNGSVKKVMKKLSENKEQQESGAMNIFLEFMKITRPELKMDIDHKLPEADHDFLLKSTNGPITVQLTELVEGDFIFQKAKGKNNKGEHREYIHNSYGHMLWAVDNELRDSALVRAIETKVKKNYSKGISEILWLVIFSTSSFLQTEWYEGEQRRESKALLAARGYIANLQDFIFDEVWFTNLETKPIKIWPLGT